MAKRGNPNIAEVGKNTRFTRGSQAAKDGQKKAVIKREQNRSMRKIMKMLANTPVKKGELYDLNEMERLADVNGKNLTAMEVVALKITHGAIEDDPECRRLFLELTGAMEKEQEEDANGILAELIIALKEK